MKYLNFKKLSDKAVTPIRANDPDAGLDLTATRIIKNGLFQVWYSTDIAVEIPKGTFGALLPRSSISNDGNLMLANSLGVIDPPYRGSVQVRFNRTLKGFFTRKQYEVGERIAQLVIVPFKSLIPNEVEALSVTARGVDGFGSSGR